MRVKKIEGLIDIWGKKSKFAIGKQETIAAVTNVNIVHPDLLHYLLDNNMLQDGDISANAQCDNGNKIFNQNIDFIARNQRRYLYHDHDYWSLFAKVDRSEKFWAMEIGLFSGYRIPRNIMCFVAYATAVVHVGSD